MFRHVLDEELRKRHLSIREAAAEMGISHSTLIAARDGSRVIDTKTAQIIAKWAGVSITTLIADVEPEARERSNVTQALEIIFKAAPDLEETFLTAANELEQGTISLDDFRDIVEYASYKIKKRREQAIGNEQAKAAGANR